MKITSDVLRQIGKRPVRSGAAGARRLSADEKAAIGKAVANGDLRPKDVLRLAKCHQTSVRKWAQAAMVAEAHRVSVQPTTTCSSASGSKDASGTSDTVKALVAAAVKDFLSRNGIAL